MPQLCQHSRITLQNADRILYKLGKHFAIKVPVELDPRRAHVQFPAGICEILRDDNVLRLRCEADSAEQMAQLIHIVDSHLALMARDPALKIIWHDSEDAETC